MQTSFENLPLPSSMLGNIKSLGYEAMTAIQKESLPPILAGKDVLAQAKTGSVKTAAFGIGIIHKIKVTWFKGTHHKLIKLNISLIKSLNIKIELFVDSEHV